MRKLLLSIIVVFFIQTFCRATGNIRVEIFNDFRIKTVMISPVDGKYEFSTDKGTVYKFKKNNIIYFTLIRDSISVWDLDQHLGMFKWIQFKGLAKTNAFKIEPAYPALTARFYEGDILISVKNENFYFENQVSIDSYLTGVVEAESGPNAPYEYYKSQAIISRTYLLELMLREGIDNYKIGDDVNHQVYKGMSVQNPMIKQAVLHTTGLVIVDTANQLITETFHSNSGGQTANSEDVWLSEKSYLKSIDDPFSLDQKNSTWQDTILVSDWLAYLSKNGFNLSTDSAKLDNLYFDQTSRKKFYTYKDDSILLRQIRNDFKFRSSWFSIKPEGNYLIISGKGYGHGVGLSQEGAMQMARLNYSFLDIINFYYKNVKVVDYNILIPKEF